MVFCHLLEQNFKLFWLAKRGLIKKVTKKLLFSLFFSKNSASYGQLQNDVLMLFSSNQLRILV